MALRRCLGCQTMIRSGSRCKACARAYRVPTDWANAVKARDGYRCVICGSADRVQAHHTVPRSDGGGHTMTNGRTLCHRHHQEAHHSR